MIENAPPPNGSSVASPSEQRPKLGRLRLLAWLEGVSLLVLVGVAVPLKHLAHVPEGTRIVGMLHGLAFLAYMIAVVDALGTRAISGRQAAWALLGAVLPGGSFVFARRLGG